MLKSHSSAFSYLILSSMLALTGLVASSTASAQDASEGGAAPEAAEAAEPAAEPSAEAAEPTAEAAEPAAEASAAENLSAPEEAVAACSPSCRDRYTCVEGSCVSLCNPACPEGSACTAEGQCVSTAPVPAPAPAAVAPSAAPPPPRYQAAVTTTWIAAAITLTGAVLVGVGASGGDCFDIDTGCYRSAGARAAGILTMIGGMTMLAISMPIAIVRRNKHRDWETQHGGSATQLSISPLFARSDDSTLGGLSLQGSF